MNLPEEQREVYAHKIQVIRQVKSKGDKHSHYSCFASLFSHVIKNERCEDLFQDTKLDGKFIYEPMDKGK